MNLHLNKRKKQTDKFKEDVKKDFNDALKIAVKKGNVIALAIGVLIGSAFGAIINSLANDIIMNAIAKLFNVRGVDALSVGTTKWTADGLPVDGIKYGKFLAVVISFFIITIIILLATTVTLFIFRRIQRRRMNQNPNKIPVTTDVNQLILKELVKLNEQFASKNQQVANHGLESASKESTETTSKANNSWKTPNSKP